MDEFEKNEILDGEENETELSVSEETVAEENTAVEETTEQEPTADAEEGAEADEKTALEAELEEIRDMFQKELDAARDGAENEMLIQELDDTANELHAEIEDEAESVPLCECCGENARSKDYGEDYPYCDSCRELMKRYPLRWSGIAAIFVAVVLIFATGYFSLNYLESSISAADILMTFGEGKTYSALQNSYSYLSTIDADEASKKVIRKSVDGYINTGYYSDAAALIENYFTEAELKLPWNSKYKKIVDESTALTETYYAVSDLVTPAANGEDYDYDEVMAQLDALLTMNPKAEGKSSTVEKYNDVFIEYYKYILMSISEKPLEDQLSQLKKVDEIGKGYEWTYLSNLCAVAARLSDEETVNASFEKAMGINKQDMNMYLAKASYYRYLETPDADKILEVCTEAAANSFNGDVSYKQYEAIAYLIKGEGAVALECIEEAISSVYTVETCNLYALIGLYNGNAEIYDEMKELLEGSGYEISQLVTKYKNGKITIEEIIADKGGEI